MRNGGNEPGSEQAARAILRKSLRKIERFLWSPVCPRVLASLILQLIELRAMLLRERGRRRRTRSKAYVDARRKIFDLIAGPLGVFATLPPGLLATLDVLLDGIITSLRDPRSEPRIDPASFLELQKKIFVVPRKRGAKLTALYDEAHRRYHQGEPIKSIARDLQPEDYRADPENSKQKFGKAIKRRDPVGAS